MNRRWRQSEIRQVGIDDNLSKFTAKILLMLMMMINMRRGKEEG